MSTELVHVRKLRSDIPEEHTGSDDERFEWLWMQRLATVGSIYLRAKNPRDRMAAKVVLDSTMSANLPSIELLLRRLEGGAVADQTLVEEESLPI
jgi:hypothetical protein